MEFISVKAFRLALHPDGHKRGGSVECTRDDQNGETTVIEKRLSTKLPLMDPAAVEDEVRRR